MHHYWLRNNNVANSTFIRIAIALVMVMGGFSQYVGAESADFTKDILPLLATKCFACHGPEPEKRQVDRRL